jgi:Relaxase/Mobilisation nuclease domain
MTQAPNLDGVLITWGDRLFYPGNRVVKGRPPPKLSSGSARQHAAALRERIAATAIRRAPQVMVKVTGGGRCMQAIAAHFRYISKNGRLDIEEERGETMRGREAVHALAEDWRFGGTLIDDFAEPGQRREAFNLMLSMPQGTDPQTVQKAVREFAQTELADHKYVMVLHEHQANPHVHISVRAESKHGQRLNPRKADLHRWRETFAEKLRDYGIDAEATRQATHGRLRRSGSDTQSSPQARASRAEAVEAWKQIGRALVASGDPADRALARSIAAFIREMPLSSVTRSAAAPERAPEIAPMQKPVDVDLRR